MSPEFAQVLNQSFVFKSLTQHSGMSLPHQFVEHMKKLPAGDLLAVKRNFARHKVPECQTGLLLKCPDEDGPHVLLLDWTLLDTQSLGHGLQLVKLELLPLRLDADQWGVGIIDQSEDSTAYLDLPWVKEFLMTLVTWGMLVLACSRRVVILTAVSWVQML